MTLIEVMVAASLFLMLSMVLYWVTRYAGAAQRKHTAATTGQRAVALALQRIERRLLTARVIEPAVGDSADKLTFRQATADAGGNLVTEPDGRPVWGDPSTLELESASGLLRVIRNGQPPEVVANLGPEGESEFTRLSTRSLQVRILAQESNPGDLSRGYRQERVVQLYIQNQDS